MAVALTGRAIAALVVTVALLLPQRPEAREGVLQASTYRPVDFRALASYIYNPKAPFDMTPPRAGGSVPASVRVLHGQKIRITGNAMAIDYSSGFMTEFILNSSIDYCGFGAEPRINEWIYVRMAPGGKARIYTGVELEVAGTLTIREEVENGLVVGLYSIVADQTK
jgi:hypothetical protein